MGGAALTLLATTAQAATVEVHIRDIASSKGHVLVQLCTQAEFMKSCAARKAVPAARNGVTVKFENVAPGLYAGMAVHDENDNKQMDRSPLGIPTEGAGFSGKAAARAGPPTFADVAVTVPAKGTTVDIGLIYY
jgi:uncharacterized protein (DUF2141 family)